MRFVTFAILLLCTATTSVAGTICGTVRHSANQQPIAHAAVLLFNAQNQYAGRSAVTDLSGFYCITDVPDGTYSVLVQVDGFAAGGVHGVVVDDATGVDIDATPPFHLADPAPNPASRHVAFRIATPPGADVTLEVFDVGGRRVMGWRGDGSGDGTVYWDLRDTHGDAIASGVYLVRLRAAGTQQVKRLVCVR